MEPTRTGSRKQCYDIESLIGGRAVVYDGLRRQTEESGRCQNGTTLDSPGSNLSTENSTGKQMKFSADDEMHILMYVSICTFMHVCISICMYDVYVCTYVCIYVTLRDVTLRDALCTFLTHIGYINTMAL